MTEEHERRDEEAREVEDEEEVPRITLDRYLSKRRPRPKSGISHIAAMVLMLITLVLVIIYKDRCAGMVSGLMGDIDAPTDKRPSVRFKIQPGPSSKPGPASQPAR